MNENPNSTIYEGKYIILSFDAQHRILVSEWVPTDRIEMDDFKKVLLFFLDKVKEYRPKGVIWMQEAFHVTIPTESHHWIENNINKKCLEYGLEKLAFVVGKNVMTHLSIYNYFELQISCFQPRHFACKQDALDWICNRSTDNPSEMTDIDIKYVGKTKTGKSQFTIETNTNDTEAALKSFQQILGDSAFIKANEAHFCSLTKREKEVFQLYANGETLKDIALKLFLSEFTVRTHWRNTKKKLGIRSLSDIADYRNAFLK